MLETLTLRHGDFILGFKSTPNISDSTSKTTFTAFGFRAKNKEGISNEAFMLGDR